MKKLFSPAIKAAGAFAMGGAAFALANLLLARHLSTQDFGHFSLILSITLLSIPLGPMGLDSVALRHRPGPQIKLLGGALIFGAIGAILVAALAAKIYALDSRILLVLGIAIMAGSLARMSASIFQSVERFKAALLLMQAQNITLIIAAVAAGIFTGISSDAVFSLYAVQWVIVAMIGWYLLLFRSKIPTLPSWKIPWPEIPALFGYLVTHNLSTQVDKLLIPKLMDIETLATFGVLSPLVMAPFKMLQSGVGYTLVPRLKSATSLAHRTRLALHEAKTTSVIVVLSGSAAFIVAPWVTNVFLNGKYELSQLLIASAVFSGVLRVAAMYASSIVTALGESHHLMWMTRASWIALSVSVIGGAWGVQWGLPGFIFGFALGLLVRTGIATFFAIQVWHLPIPPPKIA